MLELSSVIYTDIRQMERDWVPTVANPAGYPHDLTHLNSVMRRIDLICKLIAPLFISFIISRTSVSVGVFAVGLMSASSWLIEMLAAYFVYHNSPALRAPKRPASSSSTDSIGEARTFTSLTRGLKQFVTDFRSYFSTSVWIPSLSLSLLHLSALSYGATFMTFLLSAGFDLDTITIARALGSVVEISSTVVTPFGVRILGTACKINEQGFHGIEMPRSSSGLLLVEDGDDEMVESAETKTVIGLERLGLWGLCWQLGNLVCSIARLSYFFYLEYRQNELLIWSIDPGCSCSLESLTHHIFTT